MALTFKQTPCGATIPGSTTHTAERHSIWSIASQQHCQTQRLSATAKSGSRSEAVPVSHRVQAVDLLDDCRSIANPYLIGKTKPRKAKPEYRGNVNVD